MKKRFDLTKVLSFLIASKFHKKVVKQWSLELYQC